MTYYEELFIKETGKQVWLPTWSEKFNEQRFFLNPEYCKWITNYINIITMFHDVENSIFFKPRRK